MSPLLARQSNSLYYNCNSYGYYVDSYGNCYYSTWSAYGRWILLGAIIIGFFLFFLLFSCITARRRRAAGVQPYRFTHWAAGPPVYSQNVPYGHQQANASAPPPGYGGGVPPPQQQPQHDGTYYGAPTAPQQAPYGQNQNQGYFGGQQTGIELQTPQPAYGAPEVKGNGTMK